MSITEDQELLTSEVPIDVVLTEPKNNLAIVMQAINSMGGDEIIIIFERERMTIGYTGMVVYTVVCYINTDQFEEYSIRGERQKIIVNATHITNFLSILTKKDKLQIRITEDESSMDFIIFQEDKPSRKCLNTRLLDPSKRDDPKNYLAFASKFKAGITIPISTLNSNIQVLDKVGGTATISINHDKMIIASKAVTQNVSMEITRDDEEVSNYRYDYTDHDVAVSIFGTEYLKLLSKFKNVGSYVHMYIGNMSPIMFVFQSDTIENVVIAIAPRKD